MSTATVICQGFTRGMAAVGLVLTVALLSGKGHPQTLGLCLGVFGALLLLQTALPALRLRSRLRREPEQAANAESKAPPAARNGSAQQKRRAKGDQEGCAKEQQVPPRRLVLRGFLASVVVLGAAALVYYVAPIAP